MSHDLCLGIPPVQVLGLPLDCPDANLVSDFDFRRLRPGIDGAIPFNTRLRRVQK
jgi:hypothetical protein